MALISDKMALISDKKFPRAVAKFFDPLVPAVEIRTFGSSEREQAMAFASTPAGPPARRPSLRMP